MRKFRLMLMAALLACSPSAGHGETVEKPVLPDKPVSLPKPSAQALLIRNNIRAVFALQDAAAAGHAQSPAVQQAMLAQTSRQLGEAVDEDIAWLAGDIAGFVLSGANPALAERAAQLPALAGRKAKLLNGAAKFMRGETKQALADWNAVEMSELPPNIAGRFALARAILAKAEPEDSQKFLAQAVALMPGTLVEESALRRSALGFVTAHSQAELWRRAERHARRFPQSLYAPEFLEELAAGLVEIEKNKAVLDRARLDRFVTLLPAARRRAFYLTVCRAAAAARLQDLTGFAAARVARLSPPGTGDADVAELYLSLFALTADGWSAAGARLKTVSPDQLPPLERALHRASIAVVDQLSAPLPMSEIAMSDVDAEDRIEHQARVEQALAAADTVLQAAR